MMNRVGLGLAVGAGYVLGRTKKMKLAFALGTLVAGKRMHLSPQAIVDLVSGQLRNNPQFKEIGDQLREDLRGVGRAASGARVERQLDAFADRLHGRTTEVREQLSGVVPTPDLGTKDERGEDRDEPKDSAQDSTDDEQREQPARKATAKKPAAKKTAKTAAKKAPAAKQTAPKKKAAAKRTGGAARSAARQTAGARRSKGGDGS